MALVVALIAGKLETAYAAAGQSQPAAAQALPVPTPAQQFLGMLPDGAEKRRFILDCTGCHQFDENTVGADGHFRSQEDWRARTAQMLSFAGASTGFPVISPSRNPARTAEWLIEHLGDETIGLPASPPRPDAGQPDAVRFTEFDLGSADLPHDLALDPDGNVVITGQLSGLMYVLDPATGEFRTSPPIPVTNANPRALEIDDDGTWWVLLGGPQQVARLDPQVEEWTTWPIGMHPHSIVRADAGGIWFNGHFTKDPEEIGVLDPASGHVRLFDVPTPPMTDDGTNMPYGLRMGPGGILWGTQLFGNRLVRFDTGSRDFHLYKLPTPLSGPRRPDVAPDGTVWIPQYAASSLARFDPATEEFTEYALPIPDALPYVVRVDAARGWVWIGTAAADALLRFHIDEQRFDVFPLPTPRSLVRHMALDEETGSLWLSYGNFPPVTPKIVHVELR